MESAVVVEVLKLYGWGGLAFVVIGAVVWWLLADNRTLRADLRAADKELIKSGLDTRSTLEANTRATEAQTRLDEQKLHVTDAMLEKVDALVRDVERSLERYDRAVQELKQGIRQEIKNEVLALQRRSRE